MRVSKYFILISLSFLSIFLFAQDDQEEQRQKKQEAIQEEDSSQNTKRIPIDSVQDIKKYKSGVFLRASIGGVVHYASFKGSYGDTTEIDYAISELNTTIGASLGYQFFINAHNGLRLYGTGFYGDFKSLKYQDNKPFYLVTLGVGLDYLLDFTKRHNSFGFFAGVGYEWNYGKFINDLRKHPYIINKNILKPGGFFVHIGFSKMFSWRHRLELEYCVPIYKFLSFSGSGIDSNNRPYSIQRSSYNVIGDFIFSYIYTFGKKSAN